MKKFVALIMCGTVVLSLLGCSGTTAENINQPVEIQSSEKIEETSAEDVSKEDASEDVSKEDASEEETADEFGLEEITVNVDDMVVQSTPEEALEFAKNMKAGWNLGNTLDAWNEGQHNQINSEVCWGNPKTTKEMMELLKDSGFSTVRIPVSWHNHLTLSEDGNHLKIDDEWLARVKEIVDYGIDSGLYVIINIHHDNEPEGKFGYIPDYDNEAQALWYVSEIWSQVAPYFKDYDEHLIFESLNEPRLTNDSTHEWWFESGNSHCEEAADVINKMNQRFIDIVRSSGGNNVNRYVMIPGYCAQIAVEKTDYFVLPTDPASYKLMVAYHAYIPYDFALNPDMNFDTFHKEKAAVDMSYNIDIANKFMKDGVPVVLGEYGAREKNDNLSERVAYYEFYVKKCADAGIPSVVWDNGEFSGSGERFGLMDRANLSFRYPEIIKAIVDAYK